jgi:hypothetical protein
LNSAHSITVRRFDLSIFSRPAGACSVRGPEPAVETAGCFRLRLRRRNEYWLQISINYSAGSDKTVSQLLAQLLIMDKP